MDRVTAKGKISELVGKFLSYDRQGKLTGMSEEDTKRIFIEPLFEALGWDIRNPEEVWENRSQAGGKRPDYAFRIDGVVRFFLEAKEAGVELSEPEAWQAINYSYNNSVPWAVLTNFRELVIYNANWKAERSEESRFLRIEVSDYIGSFEDLWLLSKEEIVSGEMEKKAQKYGRLAREPVTKALYSDLMRWRSMISKSVSKNDPRKKFTKALLDEAVQRFLNRLIFIRTCEDRKIENEQLRAALRQWREKNNRKLRSYVQEIVTEGFVDTYDSDIFFPHMAGEIPIEDEALAQVLDELYKSPSGAQYNFDAINADVLGSIYEQYLATVMREGGSLIEKDGKRKEMGIYYTPTYIVDYIVKNTLGEFISKAKSSEDLQKITVLDPACGSGSFLIRAFETLRAEYAKKNGGDSQMLSENISKNAHDILTMNLYGVDLDIMAIEIADLNLLLRAATRRGLLPPLWNNVKRGNSLISGTKEEMEEYFGRNWKEKHPFNWETEFKGVMDNGGFDVVIGNPPYVTKELSLEEREYFNKKYKASSDNLYKMFMDRAISLLKDGGYFGFIIPNSYLSDNNSVDLRKKLLKETSIKKIVLFAEKTDVFQGVVQAVTIIVFQKGRKGGAVEIAEINDKDDLRKFIAGKHPVKHIDQKLWIELDDVGAPFILSAERMRVVTKLMQQPFRLENFLEIYREVNDKLYPFIKDEKSKNNYPMVRGRDLTNYYVKLPNEKQAESWFDKKCLKKDRSGTERLVIQHVSNQAQKKRIKVSVIPADIYCHDSTYAITVNEPKTMHAILALLNSKVLNYFFKALSSTNNITIPEIEKLPCFDLLKTDLTKISEMAKTMLSLNRKLAEMEDSQSAQKHQVEEEIARTDAQIDELIYKLYGITDEEKKIIENSFSTK